MPSSRAQEDGEALPPEPSPLLGPFTETLLDSVPTGVVVCDEHGRIVVVNRAMRALHQLPDDWPTADLDTAASKLLAHLRRPDGSSLTPDETPLRRALRGEQVGQHDLLLFVPGYPMHYLDCNARVLPDQNGAVIGAVSTYADVTAQRRSVRASTCELAVARVLADADTLADAAPAVVKAIGETLGLAHVILWLTDGLADVLRPAGTWHAVPDPTVLPIQVERGVGITGTAWQTGEPVWIPDVRTAAGAPRMAIDGGICALLAVPVPGTAGSLGVLVCASDTPQPDDALLKALLTGVAGHIGHFVSGRREQELTHELTRSKEDYVALVSHELRTPLTSIASYTELLGASAEQWPESDRMLLEVISRNTAQLRALVDELLDLAAVESGHLMLDPQEIDFGELVALLASDLNNVRLDVEEPLLLRGDPERLRQVVEHLLSNAVKFSPDATPILVTLATEGETAVLRVSDEGIGIPVGEQGKVLDALYRSTTTAHSGIPGAGLGLTLSKALVEAHGGSLTLTPGGSRGTVATVRLPVGQ